MDNKALIHGAPPTPEKAPLTLSLAVDKRPALKDRLLNLARFIIASVGRFRMARDMDWETWRRLEYRNEFPDYERKHSIEYRMWL